MTSALATSAVSLRRREHPGWNSSSPFLAAPHLAPAPSTSKTPTEASRLLPVVWRFYETRGPGRLAARNHDCVGHDGNSHVHRAADDAFHACRSCTCFAIRVKVERPARPH